MTSSQLSKDALARLSRSGRTNALGKMTAEISKLKIPPITKEILEAEAHDVGIPLTEYCRLVLMVKAHGIDAMLSVEHERLHMAAIGGSEKGE